MNHRRSSGGPARLLMLALAVPVALAGTLVVATPAQAGSITPTPCADNGGDRHVTRETALIRARSWLDPKVPYSQERCYQNSYGDYRTDCSGFVAMAWGFGGQGSDWWTGNLHLRTTPIPRDSLRQGDALLRHTGDPDENHVALFVKWADSARTSPVVIEQTGDDTVEGTIQRTWSSSKASLYTPVRYDGIVDADGISGSISDVSGDGYADILATKPDSTLHYYSNNINSNPDNLPYISSRQIGSGWNTFNRVMSGDVSGDGYADVIATKPDGTLWYYPNNINSNPDNKPYNTGREIGGPGWNTYNRVLLGDVNGDGYADIIATKPDGTLHYYPNNINSSPDGKPYAGGREIGGPGWNAYNRLMIGDVSGDGYADLIATKPDGTLHYYSNNINSNPDNLPYISSREIGGPGWNAYNRVMAGDVSGDGYADLIATKPDGTLHYYSNNIKSNPDNLPYIGSREIGGPGWNSYNRVF
ncbi:FG-GAP-like repeat-containing protein [Micromonospora sp. IBSANI012]|uniref:FG-GAP-like repeat-containing protein n=1 Tax=Micromonospora sp. IBSANI012 TaxID=3457761 RepID=UPI0040586888